MPLENYRKGEVVELDEDKLITSPDDSVVHMRVNAGSKISNLITFAMKRLKEEKVKQMTWNGSGLAVAKTISCAEICKRRVKGLFQVTTVKFKRVEEYWEPTIEGLERLKVNRDIPSISILLSKETLNSSLPGYQAPGCCNVLDRSDDVGGPARTSKRRKYKNKNDSTTGATAAAERKKKNLPGSTQPPQPGSARSESRATTNKSMSESVGTAEKKENVNKKRTRPEGNNDER